MSAREVEEEVTTMKKKKDNGDRNTRRGASISEEEEDKEPVLGRGEGKLHRRIIRSIYSIGVKGILDFSPSLLVPQQKCWMHQDTPSSLES